MVACVQELNEMSLFLVCPVLIWNIEIFLFFISGDPYDREKRLIFRNFTCMASCVRIFILFQCQVIPGNDQNPRECTWKKIDRGAWLIFLGLKFLIFLFFWVWKISLIFLGLKIFHLFFGGNNFDTIYFFGCLIKRSWFAKPLKQ